jgi:hypothetical protein
MSGFDLRQAQEPDDPDLLSFFENRFGVQNANLMFHGRANFSVVAVMIRSAKADSDNGLHAITHAVFKGGKRQHVDSIAFTVPQVTRTDGSGAKWLSGNLVMLNNPQPLFPCDEIRSIFRPAQG